MKMKTPTFLRNAEQLDKWLEQFNPLQGLTLPILSGYFADADQGRFSNVMWLARKMIRRDPTIRACVRRIYAQLMRLKWEVKIMETLPAGMADKQAEAQRDYLKAQYERIENLKQAAAASAMADLYGFAHLEKHYDVNGDVIRLQHVPQWHWTRTGLYGEWRFNPSARPWPRETLPIEPRDFVTREVDDPWLEIALIYGVRENQNGRDWDGFCARYGIPSTFFIAPPGATQEKLDEFADMADDLAADGTGALPSGSDVKTHESRSGGEAFEMKSRHHQSAIVLAATGGLLTMLAQSGSGTLAGGAHSDTWRDLVAGIAAEVTECFQEQLDKAWLAEKFPGQQIAAYFELEFPEEKTDVKALVESVRGLKQAGFKVARDWIAEETGMPLEDYTPPPPPGQQPQQQPQPKGKEKPIKNRFTGGPPSVRDRAEAMQLAEAAIQDVLDVTHEITAPLVPDITALIALAENDQASEADFIALAEKTAQLVPELFTADTAQQLAQRIEAALSTAAALGARAGIRQRSNAQS